MNTWLKLRNHAKGRDLLVTSLAPFPAKAITYLKGFLQTAEEASTFCSASMRLFTTSTCTHLPVDACPPQYTSAQYNGAPALLDQTALELDKASTFWRNFFNGELESCKLTVNWFMWVASLLFWVSAAVAERAISSCNSNSTSPFLFSTSALLLELEGNWLLDDLSFDVEAQLLSWSDFMLDKVLYKLLLHAEVCFNFPRSPVCWFMLALPWELSFSRAGELITLSPDNGEPHGSALVQSLDASWLNVPFTLVSVLSPATSRFVTNLQGNMYLGTSMIFKRKVAYCIQTHFLSDMIMFTSQDRWHSKWWLHDLHVYFHGRGKKTVTLDNYIQNSELSILVHTNP